MGPGATVPGNPNRQQAWPAEMTSDESQTEVDFNLNIGSDLISRYKGWAAALKDTNELFL